MAEIAGKSKRETEKILLAKSAAPETARLKESTRVATATHTEVKFFLDEEGMKLLCRARELVRADSTADLFTEALKVLIAKKEQGLGKVESKEAASELDSKSEEIESPNRVQKSRPLVENPSNSRFIPPHFKRQVHARSGGRCEYISPVTRARCSSRAHLQVDHIAPLALGERTEQKNLRHLCSAHNLKAAMDLGLPQSKGALPGGKI